MSRAVSKLTYANVVATLALFIAVGGGAAFAAGKIRSGDIADGAVRTADVHKRAITSGKLAVGSVRGNQIADGALGSAQIKDGSIKPSSLAVPVSIVASGTGGAVAVPRPGTVDLPLDINGWTQAPGQIDLVAARIEGTLAYGSGAPPICTATVQLLLNGEALVGRSLSTASTSLVPVAGNVALEAVVDPPASSTNSLSARVSSQSENCLAGSTIDSVRVRVIGIG